MYISIVARRSAPPLALQIIAWLSLSLILAFSAKRWLRDRPVSSSDPLLNNRVGRLHGETALVTQAIESGSGRVKVGDSEWIARGADTAAGARVRIIGSNGAELLVEPVALLEGDSPPGGEG